MAKIIEFNADARGQLKSGVDQLANAVKVTFVQKDETLLLKEVWCTRYH